MDDKEYRQGYEQGVKDFADRIKKYYNSLGGSTTGFMVEYTIDIFKEEILNAFNHS
jgi:hypothetical protein